MEEIVDDWSSRRGSDDDAPKKPPQFDLTKESNFLFTMPRRSRSLPQTSVEIKRVFFSINQCLKRIFIR